MSDNLSDTPHPGERPGSHFDPSDCDPRVPAVRERLAQRASGGGYVVPDTHIVLAIRAYHQQRDIARYQDLFEILIERCRPTLKHFARGLPASEREDAIEDMTMQLLQEVIDPRETFMTQNFGVYLKRLCVDNFNRALRSSGHAYRVDDQGQVAGRPRHVPAPLVRSLDQPAGDGDDLGESVADPQDDIAARLSNIQAAALLRMIADPLDRTIVYLREVVELPWEEIARICGKTERTMRTRHARAMAFLRERLSGGGQL